MNNTYRRVHHLTDSVKFSPKGDRGNGGNNSRISKSVIVVSEKTTSSHDVTRIYADMLFIGTFTCFWHLFIRFLDHGFVTWFIHDNKDAIDDTYTVNAWCGRADKTARSASIRRWRRERRWNRWTRWWGKYSLHRTSAVHVTANIVNAVM